MSRASFRPFSLGAILLLVLLAALALFILWGIYQAAFPPRPPFQGQMEARTISIASRAPGRIGRVLVKEGDMVKKGQPVAELALPELEAKLAQAQAGERASKEAQSLIDEGPRSQEKDALRAEWERARAGATLAEKTYARLEGLYREGLISPERHDEAYASMMAARQAAVAAREQYDMALAGARAQEKAGAADVSAGAAAGVEAVEALTIDRVLYAPRDGQVDRVLLVEGEIIAPWPAGPHPC